MKLRQGENDMHKQKYWLLLLPALFIGFFVLAFLPADKRHYVFIIPILFWIIYYTWIYLEKRIRNR